MDKKSYINKVRYEQYTNAASSLSPIVYGSLIGNAVTATTATNVPFTGLTGTPTIWNQNTTGTANLAIALTTTLPISGGGTGQTTVKPALNALLPTQVAKAGKYLRTEGVNAYWDDIVTTATSANDLTGPALAASIVNSSLTSLGTLTNLSASGVITGTNTTASTSSATGAVIIAGGLGIAKDCYINSHKIGRGAGNSDENIAIGRLCMDANTGTNVTAIGVDAANGNDGSNVVAVGYRAAWGNDSSNVIAIGYRASLNNVGEENIAIGAFACSPNNGSGNIAIGFNALTSHGGSATIGIGGAAGGNNTGAYLIGIGQQAGYNNTGYANTAIGSFALNAGCTGHYNTAIGDNALGANTTGRDNTCVGAGSFGVLTTGSYNTALGGYAGDTLTTGSDNVIIGFESDFAASGNSNSIVIGKGAVGLGSNTTVIGVSATTATKLFGSLSITGDTINVPTQKTPASATATGTKGDIVHDTNYIYVCTATNTWKRTAISTW